MKLRLYLLFALAFLQLFGKAQTLPPGAIAFIGIQGDHPITFAVITLQEIEPHTQISFTDNKWTGTHLLSNEGTIVWTSPDTALPMGTILRFADVGPPNMQLTGPGTATGRIFHFLGQGDQILAYTGPSTAPSFIAGISTNYWRAECDTISFFEFRTCLPPPLQNGVHALSFVNVTTYNIDNGYFGISPFNPTGPENLPIINNPIYWYLSNGIDAGAPSWPNWASGGSQTFASTVNFAAPTEKTIDEGGEVAVITLNINNPQPIPQTIVLNIIEFTGITSSDYLTNPPVENGTITLQVPSNATSVSFTVQALIDGFPELQENVTFVIGSTSSGLVKGLNDAFIVRINNTDNQNLSQIQFESDTVDVMEGSSGASIRMTINPPAPQSYFVILNVNNGPGIQTDYVTTPSNANGQLIMSTDANSPIASFTFTPFDDFQIEPDEHVTFTITVTTPQGLTIGNKSSVVVRIRDNDLIPAYIPPNLILNEINAFNHNYADEFGQFDDWIELYNADTGAVNLSGYHLTNTLSNPTQFRFPNLSSQLTMEPGSYMIIWADQTTTQGVRHVNFSLNPEGGFIGLYAPDGETLIDGTFYPATDSLKNFGRIPTGSDNWKYIYYPTPGAANSDSIPGVSIAKIENTSLLHVWPNPASSQLRIVKAGDPLQGEVQIRAIDLGGRTVPLEITSLENGKSWAANISKLSSGMYQLLIYHREGISRIMFTVAR